MQAENEKILNLMHVRLPDMLRIVLVITVSGVYCFNMFGMNLVIPCIICTLICNYLVKAGASLKDLRKKKNQLGEENKSRLGEIFNNVKMIKLYGW